MGTRIKKWTYTLFVLLYLLSLLAKNKFIIAPTFVTNYLADILAIPLILSATVVLLKIIKKNHVLQLSALQIIVAFVYISVVFEFLLPQWDNQYTSDYFDIICYALGTIFYLISEKTPLRFSKSI